MSVVRRADSSSSSAPSWRFVPDGDGQPRGERTSSVGIVAFTLLVFTIVFALVMGV